MRVVSFTSLPRSHPASRGYSFLEVLISIVILVSGILAVINFFPMSLKAGQRAELLTQAALLAQQKAEETRRDCDAAGALIDAIRMRATETDPIVAPDDPRLEYSFSGRSVIHPNENPGDPRDDWFVPRVIVRYNPAFRPSADVIYELRFDR
ncbi:MAG: hypothetical protein NTW86_00735 [Candidatus Sumerlaeota bacterium]|nr:hypothetical protein [Candidatus Sumerlaeota bacterium]